MKWFIKRYLKLQILWLIVILLYLYYVLTVIRFSSKSKSYDDKVKSQFRILTNTAPPTISTESLSTNVLNKIKNQNISNVQCVVTVAIILCEDDRYLTIKKKPPINNFSIQNVSDLKRPVSGQPTSFTTPKRQIIAKDFSRQINQTLVLLKSIAIMMAFADELGHSSEKSTYKAAHSFSSTSCVEVLLLSDKPSHYNIIHKEIKKTWSENFKKLVKVTSVPVRYPSGSSWMKNLFRPCATLRLFLAELLPTNIDSVLYLDTDIIFLRSIQTLWTEFERFDKDDEKDESDDSFISSVGGKSKGKLAAMAPCLVHYGTTANLIPYFGSSGLNAGIMLMNLTRMRASQWTNKLRMVTTMFQDKIKLADQDLLNIYFHFFPEELHLLSCDWNFRPFQCRPGSYCEDPELSQGISALHGNALSFTTHGPEPFFRAVFQTFHKVKLNENFQLEKFINQIETSLVKADESTHKYNSQCKQYGQFDILLLNRLYNLIER